MITSLIQHRYHSVIKKGLNRCQCKLSGIDGCHLLFHLHRGRASMACTGCSFLIWWKLNACSFEMVSQTAITWTAMSTGLCPHLSQHLRILSNMSPHPDMLIHIWNEYQQQQILETWWNLHIRDWGSTITWHPAWHTQHCLTDGGRDGLWWPALSGHWLSCMND